MNNSIYRHLFKIERFSSSEVKLSVNIFDHKIWVFFGWYCIFYETYVIARVKSSIKCIDKLSPISNQIKQPQTQLVTNRTHPQTTATLSSFYRLRNYSQPNYNRNYKTIKNTSSYPICLTFITIDVISTSAPPPLVTQNTTTCLLAASSFQQRITAFQTHLDHWEKKNKCRTEANLCTTFPFNIRTVLCVETNTANKPRNKLWPHHTLCGLLYVIHVWIWVSRYILTRRDRERTYTRKQTDQDFK